MNTILESITEKDYTSAEQQLQEKLNNIVTKKLHEMKKMIAAKMTEQSLSNPSTLRSVEYAKRGLTETENGRLSAKEAAEKAIKQHFENKKFTTGPEAAEKAEEARSKDPNYQKWLKKKRKI